jgi:hypothetical protein
MHRTSRTTLRSARPAVVATLAVGLALLAPGSALASTTEPTPVTTTTTAPPQTTTTAPTTTAPTGTTSPTTSATGSATTTTDPSTTTGTTSPSTAPSTTSAPTTKASSTQAPSASATTKASGKSVPFGAPSAKRAAAIPADSAAQAGYAGGFIVRTIAKLGDHYNYPGGTVYDGGNTVDALLALDGAKVGVDQADQTADYLAGNIDAYVGSEGESYAGPLGKLIIGIVAHGGDPTDVGQDLVARLEGLMADTGRFQDDSTYGDYSNTIGQALDIIALGRATGEVPQEAVDFLLAQQCDDGGFRGDPNAATCVSDLDATGFAAQALVGAGEDTAAGDALDFLVTKQAANGGFLNQDGQYNANTAGVAAQAFAAGGRASELALAQDFIASLQMDCSFATALRGGIAFTEADYATLKKTPTNTDAHDRTLRATPQAALALAGGSLLDVSADESTAAVPALTCATTSTTTTSPATSSTSTGTESSDSQTSAPVTDPSDDSGQAASATPGDLAFTGANAIQAAALGLALLVAGVVALVIARRKGAHA